MTDDLLRGADTAELRFHPAAVQKDERRDAHDPEALREQRLGIDIRLAEFTRAAILCGQRLYRGRECLAGAAPCRIEVDQHRPVGVLDLCGVVFFRKNRNIHWKSHPFFCT